MNDTRIVTFVAKDDAGNAVTITAWQEWHDTTTMRDASRQCAKGMKYLRTSDGKDVNFVDPRTFQVVETGQILRTDTDQKL